MPRYSQIGPFPFTPVVVLRRLQKLRLESPELAAYVDAKLGKEQGRDLTSYLICWPSERSNSLPAYPSRLLGLDPFKLWRSVVFQWRGGLPRLLRNREGRFAADRADRTVPMTVARNKLGMCTKPPPRGPRVYNRPRASSG